jgi:hypothetical protein
MMKIEDPSRLVHSGDAAVRSVLRSAEGDSPNTEQLAALAGQLAAVVPAAVGASVATTATKSLAAKAAVATPILAKSAAVKGIATVAVLMAVGGGAVVTAKLSREPKSIPAAVQAPPDDHLAAAPREPAPDPQVVDPGPQNLTPSARPATRAPEAPSRPALSDHDRSLAETRLLEQAADALRRGDASHALRLTAEHASEYPRGALTEERERIAIEALARSGQLGAARARARRFRTRFPGSTYHRRLEVLLSEADGGG